MNLQSIKYYAFLMFVMVLFMSSGDCKKAGDDCHYSITIKNNSLNEIIAATRVGTPGGKCHLDGKKLSKGESEDYRPFNFCIERSTSISNTIDDKDKLYDCESISEKDEVLKHYALTLDDLKQNNFTVTYQ
jgi:hypothetical protein